MSLSSGAALALVAVLLPMPSPPPPPIISDDGDGSISTVITSPGSPGGSVVPIGAGGGSGAGGVSCSYTPNPSATLQVGRHASDGDPTRVWSSASDVPAIIAAMRGQMYTVACTDGTASTVWVPDATGAAAPAGVPVITPAQLAQQLRNSLQLPKPEVSYNPNPQVSKVPPLVNLPTWWWTSNSKPLSQRTALGGVWAEVTATPVSTTWTASDGSSRTCEGLGVAWAPGIGEDAAGACTYTYRHAHESETATIAVTWDVTWVGSGGTGGALEPMAMTSQVVTPVFERQAVAANGGS